jgi:glyoxalase family protein
LLLELVFSASAEARPAWGDAPGIPRAHAVHGFHSITVWVESGDASEQVLVQTLGFHPVGESGSTRRFSAQNGEAGTLVDVRTTGGFVQGVSGAGTVHHVAWSVPDDAMQLAFRERVLRSGLTPTGVIDRHYFQSVYFREPGGVLYELATNPPGFTIDEPLERLGERLMLPPQYEADRPAIEAVLPAIHLPRPASEDSFLPAGS